MSRVQSTKSQLVEFKESLIWKDIIDELDELDRLAVLEYDLVGEPRFDDQAQMKIVPNSSETLIHLGDIKGRRKAVGHFLSIIDVILQKLEIQQEEDKQSKEVS